MVWLPGGRFNPNLQSQILGLLAAHSAVLRGASRVYVMDYVQQRLNLAASIGAISIDFREPDPVQQIM